MEAPGSECPTRKIPGWARMTAFELKPRGNGEYGLGGDLTFATAIDALRATAPLFERDAVVLQFDLAEVERADSAGVAVLVEWVRRARQAGIAIHYARLPEPLSAIIRVSGVEDLLPIDFAPCRTV